jgi:hypothetical protein
MQSQVDKTISAAREPILFVTADKKWAAKLRETEIQNPSSSHFQPDNHACKYKIRLCSYFSSILGTE